MYFGVVCVVGVVGVVCVVGGVWSSCCSYTRFIIRDNDQKIINNNSREHPKNCCVCHRRFVCLIYVYFVILRELLLLLFV